MSCKCHLNGFHKDMTFTQLREFVRSGKYCTYNAHYQCSTVVRALDRARVAEDRREMYNKRLKRQGFTDEEIAARPRKGRITQTDFGGGKTFSFAQAPKPKPRRIRAAA